MQDVAANIIPIGPTEDAASDEGAIILVTTAEGVEADESATAIGELAAFIPTAVGEDGGANDALVVMRKPWLSYFFTAVGVPRLLVTRIGKPCSLKDVTTLDPPAAGESCGESPSDEVRETGGNVTWTFTY